MISGPLCQMIQQLRYFQLHYMSIVMLSKHNYIVFQAKFEKTIHLLSAVLDGGLQKSTTDNEDIAVYQEVAIVLDELKQLYAALDMRSVLNVVLFYDLLVHNLICKQTNA